MDAPHRRRRLVQSGCCRPTRRTESAAEFARAHQRMAHAATGKGGREPAVSAGSSARHTGVAHSALSPGAAEVAESGSETRCDTWEVMHEQPTYGRRMAASTLVHELMWLRPTTCRSAHTAATGGIDCGWRVLLPAAGGRRARPLLDPLSLASAGRGVWWLAATPRRYARTALTDRGVGAVRPAVASGSVLSGSHRSIRLPEVSDGVGKQ